MRSSIITLVAFALLAGSATSPTMAGTGAGSAGDFTLERDGRLCAFPFCGGWFLERPNRKLTRCADGTKQDRCYVAEIDWTLVGISASQIAAIELAGSHGRVVVRGRIDLHDAHGELGVLNARKAWAAATEAPPKGRLRRVEDTGIVCITTPCPVFEGRRLNTRRVDEFDHLALRGFGASKAHRQAAAEAADSGKLLVAGPLITKPNGSRILRAKQFYLPVGPNGCSVTCSDFSCDVVCPSAGQCLSDADCRTFSNYCDGCSCEALAVSAPDPTCDGTLVQCFVDPCFDQSAVCDSATSTCSLTP